jgi:hypothetical protein
MRKIFRSNPPINGKLPSLQQIAIACMHDLQTNDGFSRDNRGLAPIAPGYMVSMPNCELRLVHPSARTLANWMKVFLLRRGEFWGGWKDNGLTFLDVSLQVVNRSDALELARIFNQSAIYDLQSRENIALPKRPAAMVHAGNGGIQAHSIGEFYPWTIRGIGTPLRWQAFNMETSQACERRNDIASAELDARRMLQGSAYDVMHDIANDVDSMQVAR